MVLHFYNCSGYSRLILINYGQTLTFKFKDTSPFMKCQYLPEQLVQKWNGWYKFGMVGNFKGVFFTKNMSNMKNN